MSEQQRELVSIAYIKEIQRQKYKIYRKNPMLWVKDILGENPADFEWTLHGGYDNHTWDGSVNPISEAWKCIANKQWACLSAATGTAKTYSAARMMLWFLDCFENSMIITSAPKESQLRLNLWSEISKLVPKFREARPFLKSNDLMLYAEGMRENSTFQKSWLALGFVAGIGAGEDSATKAQGFHRENMLIICEEASGMDGAIMTAFKNTSTASNNIILALGNPDSEDDELGKFSKLPNVKSFRVSAYDYPNVVLNKEIYAGAVSQASIDRRRAEYGEDAPLFLSRVRGITPSGSEDDLIKGEWIDACDMTHPKYVSTPVASFNAVGIDVANSENGDKACLAWIQSGVVVDVHEFRCPNASYLAYNIEMTDLELIENDFENYNTRKISEMKVRADCIGVDAVGVGTATLQTLRNRKIEAAGLHGGEWKEIIPLDAEKKQLYSFANLRSQMYYQLREDVRNNKIAFNIPDKSIMAKIRAELKQPRFKLRGGNIAIEPKDDIIKRHGKSPNMADAIAYANWISKGYRMKKIDLPFGFGKLEGA